MNCTNVARFCVQLALENLPTLKYVIVEIDGNDDKKPLCGYFAQVFDEFPHHSCESTFLSSKRLDIKKVCVKDSRINSFNNVNIVIASELLISSEILETISNQIADRGFVVSREKSSCDLRLEGSLPVGYQIIASIPGNGELIVIMQYFKKQPTIPDKIVKMTSKNYDWLQALRKSIQTGPILAYAEKEELSGLIDLVNTIRKEPNGLNLKCFFIDDYRVPLFDINNQFYKTQLQRGLTMNVYRRGRWGSFKDLLLEPEVAIV